jgi:hypothetical protein
MGRGGGVKHNVPLTYDWENKCTWVNYTVGGEKNNKTNKDVGGGGGKRSYDNLINCVNALPSIDIIYKQLMDSNLVKCLTHVNNVDADFNLAGAKRGAKK